MRMRSSSRLSVAAWTPLCALIALALPGAASALKAPPPQLRELEEADRKALETIAGHSEPLRDAVLKASLHVDALIETQRIQEQSSASFQERIGKLDKKQQEQVWEVVREPGLLDELATEERPSRSHLDAIAERHPKELAPAIHAVGDKHHDLLLDVAQIHDRASVRFDAAIADLDDETQQAFRALVNQPELLSVLVRRVNLVVRLGDSYRKNPKDTRSYLSALAVDVEKRNAAAEREWKERIENDPKAAEELDQAARDYAEENGYDYEELTSPEARTRVTVVVNPYPYGSGIRIGIRMCISTRTVIGIRTRISATTTTTITTCGGACRRGRSCTGSIGAITTTTSRICTTISMVTFPTTTICRTTATRPRTTSSRAATRSMAIAATGRRAAAAAAAGEMAARDAQRLRAIPVATAPRSSTAIARKGSRSIAAPRRVSADSRSTRRAAAPAGGPAAATNVRSSRRGPRTSAMRAWCPVMRDHCAGEGGETSAPPGPTRRSSSSAPTLRRTRSSRGAAVGGTVCRASRTVWR